MMISNNAESLNALFKKDRELPILTLIKNIRTKLQQWFHDQREESQNCTNVLAPVQKEKAIQSYRTCETVECRTTRRVALLSGMYA